MKTLTIVIPGRLPGLNEYINAERQHRMKAATLKKEAQEVCMWAMKKAAQEHIKFKSCHVKITWYEPNKRRDKDNISAFGRKIIFDALQAMEILENDGWQEIASITENWKVDKSHPRIEITLEEVD